jgi:hypothetical protein
MRHLDAARAANAGSSLDEPAPGGVDGGGPAAP